MSRLFLAALLVASMLSTPGLSDGTRDELFDMYLKILNRVGAAQKNGDATSDQEAQRILLMLHRVIDMYAPPEADKLHDASNNLFGGVAGADPRYELRREMFVELLGALAPAPAKAPAGGVSFGEMNGGTVHIHIGDMFVQHARAVAEIADPYIDKLPTAVRTEVGDAFAAIRAEANSNTPRPNVMRELFSSARRSLESALGTLAADALKAIIDILLQ